jgi:hypothetical protein
MSIVKIGILVALVVAVLPADKEQQARLYDRAAGAVHWTATFCDRNGTTCEKAGDLWQAFVKKAQFGAQMAYELALKHSRGEQGYLGPATIEPATVRPGHGTLSRRDLQPAWRGSQSDI